MKKLIQKLIKEELAHSVFSLHEMKYFLEDVYSNMNEVLHDYEKLVIESAFTTYLIEKKSDIKKLSPLMLQNLFNSIDAKLKTLDVREFHFKSNGEKNIKLSDLI